jgi:hypothetical protein
MKRSSVSVSVPAVTAGVALAWLSAACGPAASEVADSGAPSPVGTSRTVDGGLAVGTDARTSTAPSRGREGGSVVATYGDGGAGVVVASGSDGAAPSASVDAGAPLAACSAPVCTAYNQVATCTPGGDGGVWTTTTCPSGQGCYQGVCTSNACSDECELGSGSCHEVDLSSGKTVTADSSKLHDRARLFEQWIQNTTMSLYYRQIQDVLYKDTTWATPSSIDFGDTAMHTGIYLTGEARRLALTGSYQARKNVRTLVDQFHNMFNVTGDPGLLVRFMFPSDNSQVRSLSNWSCMVPNDHQHCGVTYNGSLWDYGGNASRDMYMGPLMGLVAAYDALGTYDEDKREYIRQDLMTTAQALVQLRTLPVVIVLNGTSLAPQMMSARFFIPETGDMINGAVQVNVNTSDLGGTTQYGGQQFWPDPSLFFKQLPLLGGAVPSIPMSSSAVMVAGYIQAALHVTEGVPSYATARAALLDFYLNNNDEWGNVNTWLPIAAQWGTMSPSCGVEYFGTNIAIMGLHAWGSLEQDASVRSQLLSTVVNGSGGMWAEVSAHKNSFFSFEYAEITRNLSGASMLSGTPLTDAVRQVQSFPSPARNRVEKSGSCNTGAAAEIGDRPIVDLQWQHDPWTVSDPGLTRQTEPGHDYTSVYFMGASDGILTDDTPTSCLQQ